MINQNNNYKATPNSLSSSFLPHTPPPPHALPSLRPSSCSCFSPPSLPPVPVLPPSLPPSLLYLLTLKVHLSIAVGVENIDDPPN